MPATYVPPEGDKKTAKFIIVGAQPGSKDVRYRQPFTGPAGKELFDDLQAVGVMRSEVYLTNVIKDLDRPLEYYYQSGPKGVTLSPEGIAYIRALEQELSDVNPMAVLIPAGNVALYALTTRTGITKWRGSVVQSTINPNFYCVPIVDPATTLPPKNVYLNKYLIQFDLKKAKDLYDSGCNPLKRDKYIRPMYHECVSFLESLMELGKQGHTIDFDIEIFNEEMSCIGFAVSPTKAFCVPFVDARGNYFSEAEETHLMQLISQILEDGSIRKRGQNLVFDSHFLLKRYGIKVDNVDDTMIAQHTIMSEFPKGLDFIASIWTDIPYYKDEGKKFFKAGGAFETLWTYNCTDALVTADAHSKQMGRLIKMGNAATYERTRRLIPILTYMMEHGIKVDVAEMARRREQVDAEVSNLREELNRVVGREINPLSPAQLKNYFYKELGNKPYLKQGSVTTDEKALKRLSRKGIKAAGIVLEIRGKTKLSSTYLDVTKVDSDGRIRCSYNPVGTRFSRLSSSENIFGTGMNLQNQPHEVLEMFKADDGYVAYSMDLSQAENRIVAYTGRVREMIEAFETGKDVHALTASMICNIPYQQVIEDDKNGIKAPIGDGSKTWRFYGKRSNHGLNYDLGYKTFSLYLEIPENDAKFLVNRYHTVYPGVRQGYHQFVQNQLRKDRTVCNLMGRKTIFFDRWGDDLFKDAYACIPQGTVGDVINERGLGFAYYAENAVEFLMQVHDSIVFQIPISAGWMHHAEWLTKIKKSLETPLTVHGHDFVVPVDTSMGLCLYKQKMIDIKASRWPGDNETLAKMLEANYETLKAKS
jgi:uracil-DNA glycosylase family 4